MAIFDFLRRKEASVPLMARLVSGVTGIFASEKTASNYYNGWVFACVRAIAEEVANIDLVLYKTDSKGNDEIVRDHAVLDLLAQVNEYMTKYTLFERLQSNLELNGNEYWYLESGKGTTPKAIYPLMPSCVAPIGGVKDYVVGYKYTIDGSSQTIPAEKILQFKNFNPKSDIIGMSTLSAARTAAETDNYAKTYNKNYFQNSARPDVILEYPETLSPEDEKRLLESWNDTHSGASKQFKTAVASGGLKVSAFQLSQRDMEFLEQRRFSRDEIMGIFRVPSTVIGLTVEATFASAKAASYSFSLRTIKPKMQRIVDTLNEFLLPRYGETGLHFDFVSPVQEDRTVILQEYKDGLANGWLTLNEIRRKENLSDIEGGDTVFLPFSLQPYGKPIEGKQIAEFETKSEIKELSQTLARDIAQKFFQLPVVKEIERDKTDAKKVARTKLGEGKAAKRDERGLEYIKQFQSKLKTLWQSQLESAKKELKVFLNKKNWKASVPALIDEPKEIKATIDLFTPLFAAIAADEVESAAAELGVEMSVTPALRKYIEKNTKKFAGEITKETSRQIRATVIAGLEQNEAIPDLEKRIESIPAFGTGRGQRAEMISRTETIRAQGKAETEVWRESGVVTGKEWYTTASDQACDDCADLDGKIIEIDSEFYEKGDVTSSGAKLDYEDVGNPPLHPNCRCAVLPVIVRD